MNEKAVADLWRRQRDTTFTADDGSLIHVIFPGRPAYGGGCDFTDSIFSCDGIRLVGNAEIHVQQRDWHLHGHDNDPRYNSIVLHVVMRSDANPTRLYNGTIVPTIRLEPSIPFDLSPVPVCDYADGYRSQDLPALVEDEGYLRFLEKAVTIKTASDEGDADRVLLNNMAAALGYSRNTRQLRQLADALPMDMDHYSVTELMAVLFGIAGLLPSQRQHFFGDTYSAELESIWRSTKHSRVLRDVDWHFSGVRPNNYPPRRIAALGHLLHRWSVRGFVQTICRLIDAVPPRHSYHWLERQLIIEGDEYWDCHIDFGIDKSIGTSLLGKQRVCDMLVNVLLPTVYALSNGLAAKSLRLYVSSPACGDNEIVRYMSQQLVFKERLTACRQQGLIRLFRMHCRRRDCVRCPIGASSG